MGNSDTSPMDVRVALCQVPSREDIRSNLDEVKRIAGEVPADIYLFPELFLTGYGCRSFDATELEEAGHSLETLCCEKDIAIACAREEVSRPLAGQGADELLSIDGIRASFVLFRQQDATFISARSSGSVNVQVILETLGGGGNAVTAGAQLKNTAMDAAREKLIRAIDNYFSEE